MNKSDCVIGKIVGVYGVRGWLKVKTFTEDPKAVIAYAPWQLQAPNGEVSEYEIEAHQIRPQGLVVKLVGLDDRNAAELMRGWQISVDESVLPALEDGEFYWRELIGMRVLCTSPDHDTAEQDQRNKEAVEVSLGIVHKMLETGANDVLVIQGRPGVDLDDRERLVPYVPGIYVQHIDREKKEIRVEWDPDF